MKNQNLISKENEICSKEDKITSKEKEDELLKNLTLRFSICPNCKVLLKHVSGDNSITCPCGIIFCGLCNEILSNYYTHYSEHGYWSKACPNFPKKYCPNCNLETSKSSKTNLMKCSKCQTHWCFLCQQLINMPDPYQHYEGHKHDGKTCTIMISKPCPSCQKISSMDQGFLLISCDECMNEWCYLCQRILVKSEIYPHFKQNCFYSIHCANS